jgi:pyruvate/2-oxoglutarate dehydrogenase complex dihydrolipoamide dehydrogenase (E3) component
MTYDYDLIVIGMGPAGMAVSAMGAEMGLKVAGIEAHRIGGECMNVGCIPSKALLRMAKVRSMFDKLADYGLSASPKPDVLDPFPRIHNHLDFINEKKTVKMFDKVDLILREGKAGFVNDHTVQVGSRRLSGKRIFICAGTRPALPPLEGLDSIDVLTNENIFDLEAIPESLLVLGGGAIACEMAQAFTRLGSKITMVMRGRSVQWREDADGVALVQEAFEKEGVVLKTNRTMTHIEPRDGKVVLHTKQDGEIRADRVLAATGRRMALNDLHLDRAGVKFSEKGIIVDKYLRTSRKHIYAAGDCNGYAQLSHAAMHQGMIALLNATLPRWMRKDYRNFVVPWTMFTEPQFSHAGPRESELMEKNIRYETILVRHEDYGAAIAENLGKGFVKIHCSPAGKIYAACVVGEGSGEIINEWALAIQNHIRMHKVLFQQHSFPTMGFLSKRAAETWMMNRMKSPRLRKLAAWMYRR